MGIRQGLPVSVSVTVPSLHTITLTHVRPYHRFSRYKVTIPDLTYNHRDAMVNLIMVPVSVCGGFRIYDVGI